MIRSHSDRLGTRCFVINLVMFLVFSPIVLHCQEISVATEELDELVKLGVVQFSKNTSIGLSFPNGFMGDVIRGRVLLVNDSSSDATVGEVENSCINFRYGHSSLT
jgi:hypothetical protein